MKLLLAFNNDEFTSSINFIDDATEAEGRKRRFIVCAKVKIRSLRRGRVPKTDWKENE